MGPPYHDAFKKLKERISMAPVLVLPRDENLFVLDTDASDVAIGVALSYVQDGVERVRAHYRRLYAQAGVNYCTSQKELLAIV